MTLVYGKWFFFLEELFFQRKYNPQVRDPTHDVQVRGELISRGQCLVSTDGVLTEEWIGMERTAALAWLEKPGNVPGRSDENHDTTHDDRSWDRILNPRRFDYDVLMLTEDHSHIFVISLSSPYPL